VAIQLQRFGFAKDAITHLERAHTIRPTSSEVLTRLVTLYDMTGRPDEAETARRSLSGLKTFADAKP
jgi:Flp pilus assembly protein TadD